MLSPVLGLLILVFVLFLLVVLVFSIELLPSTLLPFSFFWTSLIVNSVVAVPPSENATFKVCFPIDKVFKYVSFKVIIVLPDLEL